MFVYFIPLKVNLTKNSKLEKFVHELNALWKLSGSSMGALRKLVAVAGIISLSWGVKKKDATNFDALCICVGDCVSVKKYGKHWIHLGHIISIDKNTKSAHVKWEETQKKDTVHLFDCKKYKKLDVIPRKHKSTDFFCEIPQTKREEPPPGQMKNMFLLGGGNPGTPAYVGGICIILRRQKNTSVYICITPLLVKLAYFLPPKKIWCDTYVSFFRQETSTFARAELRRGTQRAESELFLPCF
jgi:hypothetical protein